MNRIRPIVEPGLERRQQHGTERTAAEPAGPDRRTDQPVDQTVAAFLRANPTWLAAQPDLYRSLAPPSRIHGEVLADHMASMLELERQHARTLADQAASVLAVERSTAATMVRVHEAVVALLAAPDRFDFVLGDLPHLLDADVACLAGDVAGGRMQADAAGWRALLGRHDVLYRSHPADTAMFYAEAAPLALHDVLIQLPGVGVLGLAGRTPPLGGADSARGALRFLGRVIAATLPA